MAVCQEIKEMLKTHHANSVNRGNFLGMIWMLIHVEEPEKIGTFCSTYFLLVSDLQTLLVSYCNASSFHTSCCLKISFLVHL